MTYIPWSDFDELFQKFEHYAFRLETLPQYRVQYEDESWSAFRRGEFLPPPNPAMDSWQAMIRQTVKSGRKISRVHLWPVQMTPYLRYELEWAYLQNAEAGDDIRLLLNSAPATVRDGAVEDFWLFDDKLVVIIDYESDGTIIGARFMQDDSKIPTYVSLMRIMLEHGTPLKEYLKLVRNNEIAG